MLEALAVASSRGLRTTPENACAQQLRQAGCEMEALAVPWPAARNATMAATEVLAVQMPAVQLAEDIKHGKAFAPEALAMQMPAAVCEMEALAVAAAAAAAEQNAMHGRQDRALVLEALATQRQDRALVLEVLAVESSRGLRTTPKRAGATREAPRGQLVEAALEEGLFEEVDEWPELVAAEAAAEPGPAMQVEAPTDGFAVGDYVRSQGMVGLRELDGRKGQVAHVALGGLFPSPRYVVLLDEGATRVSAIEGRYLRKHVNPVALPGALAKQAPASAVASSRRRAGRAYA